MAPDTPAKQSSQVENTQTTPGNAVFNPKWNFCDFDEFEYDPDENRFHVTFDPTDTIPTSAVVAMIATISNTDPVSIPPLHDTIDTDALDTLASEEKDRNAHELSITFVFYGYEVKATNNGTIQAVPKSPDQCSDSSN
jgi:hypothetical protein